MKLFVTLVNKVQPLSVATDNTILDIMGGSRSTSGSNIETIIILLYLFILGKSIPIALSSNKRCSIIAEHSCLPVETAVQHYEQDSSNARIKRPEVYGDDSLHRSKKLQETRNAHFFHYFPSFREIFESVMSGDDRVFRNAVLYHIYLSEVLKFSL